MSSQKHQHVASSASIKQTPKRMPIVDVEGDDMSQTRPPPRPIVPIYQREHDQNRRQWVDEAALGFTPTNSYVPVYHEPYMAENWLVEPSSAYGPIDTSQKHWSHDEAPRLLMPFGYEVQQEKPLYSNAEEHASRTNRPNPNIASQNPRHDVPAVGSNPARNIAQPQMQSVNQTPADHGTSYRSQTPQRTQSNSHDNEHRSFHISPVQNITEYSHMNAFNTDPRQESLQTWPVSFPETQGLGISPCTSGIDIPAVSSAGLSIQWALNNQFQEYSLGSNVPSTSTSAPKRKFASPEPVAKRSRPDPPEKDLSQFVLVFENEPGALSTVKHRRKLDAPVRKAARDVRKAGACHQCRFRKRTCSTGTPCMSCLKNGNGLHEIKCQRESPFVGKLMHQYFEHSSTRRVVSFDIEIPKELLSDFELEYVSIDGITKLSYPIKLHVRRRKLDSFSPEEQKRIKQTHDPGHNASSTGEDSSSVLILGSDGDLGLEVEQWAVEYASKFVHAAGPRFYSTTMAQILGTAYVKKELPESALVGAMLRVASIAFILRAGVKYNSTGSQTSPRFRTVQARIDTILYGRLQLAEKDLFQMLQRLIFRTAGNLTRTQIYPVALVLWQLLRILCISSSHLSNIATKFHSKAHGQADYQFIGLRLVLSTHMALFRSSNPLLLDLKDKHNRDLLSGDDELIELAMQMRKVILTFKEKGFPEMKGSIAYKKQYFDMFRKVYDGM